MQARRAHLRWTAQGFEFDDAADLETYQSCLQSIEQVHQLELSLLNRRLERIAAVTGQRPTEWQ